MSTGSNFVCCSWYHTSLITNKEGAYTISLQALEEAGHEGITVMVVGAYPNLWTVDCSCKIGKKKSNGLLAKFAVFLGHLTHSSPGIGQFSNRARDSMPAQAAQQLYKKSSTNLKSSETDTGWMTVHQDRT
jgi:hypothetical protein